MYIQRLSKLYQPPEKTYGMEENLEREIMRRNQVQRVAGRGAVMMRRILA